MSLLSNKIKAQRIKLKLTSEELAKRIGVSRSYITLIENGNRLPGRKLLSKIALALELELEQSLIIEWYLKDIHNKIVE